MDAGAGKSSAEMVCGILIELMKRERGTPEMLADCVREGEQLLQRFKMALGEPAAAVDAEPETAALAELLARHAALTDELADLSERLVAQAIDERGALLRAAAQWEVSYYQQQAGLSAPVLPAMEAPGKPLDKAILQGFLNESAIDGAPVEVTELRQLTGGFGKQTYLAKYTDSRGAEQDLVIRKADATPIMKHGACNLRNEYDLLSALAPLDFPAPKPGLFCDTYGGVDGSFYTMPRIAGATPGSYLGGVEGQVDESVFLQLAEHLAQLHQVPLSQYASYAETHDDPRILTASVSETYRYNLDGWKRYIDAEPHLKSPHLVWLLDWLEQHVPDDPRPPVIVHGDYNVHNVLVDDGRVTGILDWECAGFGAPEQDLAYIKPHISEHIEWSKFVDHYLAHGGHAVNDEAMQYGVVYATLRMVLAINRATSNLQSGANQDIRYSMVELGFAASFLGQALDTAAS